MGLRHRGFAHINRGREREGEALRFGAKVASQFPTMRFLWRKSSPTCGITALSTYLETGSSPASQRCTR